MIYRLNSCYNNKKENKVHKMICSHCGKKVRKRDFFCSKCGYSLTDSKIQKNNSCSVININKTETEDEIPGTPQEKNKKILTLIFYFISIILALSFFYALIKTDFKELSHFLDANIPPPTLDNALTVLYTKHITVIHCIMLLYIAAPAIQGFLLHNMCKKRIFSSHAKIVAVNAVIYSAAWLAIPFLINILLTRITDFESKVSVLFQIASIIIAVSEIMCAVMCCIAAKCEKNAKYNEDVGEQSI